MGDLPDVQFALGGERDQRRRFLVAGLQRRLHGAEIVGESWRHIMRSSIFSRSAETQFVRHPNVGTRYVLAKQDCGRGGALPLKRLAELARL